MKKNKSLLLIIVFLIVIVSGAVFFIGKNVSPLERKMRVAVVAGFIQPFSELADEFTGETGIMIEVVYASAGKLYLQATNGAPYDMVLADEDRPARLFADGLAEKPFVYARGEVVLWSCRKGLKADTDWRDVVNDRDVRKIAIALPDSAVYGMSAKKAMENAGLWESIQPRLVFAPDLAQVFQYASTGAADLAFCNLFQAYSNIGKKGSFCRVKEAPEIVHSACVMKRAYNVDMAERFAVYMVSESAEKIKSKYGYK